MHGYDLLSLLIMRYAAPNAPSSADGEEFLETLWRAWALVGCPDFFHPNPSQHGLVSALVRDDRTVHVPIQFADLFPTQKTLEELIELAEDVRAMTDSTICLSGSHVFGIPSSVDTDFCEYVLHTGKRLAGSFIRLAAQRTSICVTVQHCASTLVGSEIQTKILDLCKTDPGNIGSECTCTSRQWYFEYFCRVPSAPTLVTNLCVHEKDYEEESIWAYQEAAIVAAGQPLRQLADPLQLGRYVRYLREETGKYRTDKPLKALKRALPLCRILSLEEGSEVLKLLRSSVSVQLAKNDAAEDVARLREHLPQEWQDEMSSSAVQDRGDHAAEEQFRSDANLLVGKVIERYELLFQLAVELNDAQSANN